MPRVPRHPSQVNPAMGTTRHRLGLLILCLGLMLCGSVSAQDLVTPSDRVTSHVNLRAEPNENAAELGELDIGEALPLVGSVPRWYEVRLPGGGTAFVSKAWTTISQALAPRRQDELRIHFLNIGAGACTVVECPGANASPMVVDCGSTGATDVDMTRDEAGTYVRNVLSQHQAAPNVVLSHADVDHYGHIASALAGLTVASVWQGGEPNDYTSNDFPGWLADQQSRGAVIHRNFSPHFHNDGQPLGDDLSCGSASTFVLTANTGSSKNAQSLMLMIEYADFTAIFTGDAEGQTEAQAMANYDDGIKATLMTASHHGAHTNGSNSQTWATSTAPEVLISSAGEKFRHPSCEATSRFGSLATTKRHGTRCGRPSGYQASRTDRAHYVTEVNGAIVVTSNGESPVLVNCTRSAECGTKIAH
jgi:competence protein ComEC